MQKSIDICLTMLLLLVLIDAKPTTDQRNSETCGCQRQETVLKEFMLQLGIQQQELQSKQHDQQQIQLDNHSIQLEIITKLIDQQQNEQQNRYENISMVPGNIVLHLSKGNVNPCNR